MPSFTRHAFGAMDDADLVLEVVDARFPQWMRNAQLENHLRIRKTPYIVVLNKSDLLHGREPDIDTLKANSVPFISICCTPKKNINRLRSLIYSMLKDGGTIAVVGYPNTGKSSIINALAGRHAAPTSKQAGFTKGKSKVRLKEDVYLWDTPGVIPLKEYDQFSLMLFAAKSPNQLKDIEILAMQLLDWLPTQKVWSNWLIETYGFQPVGDGEEQLEAMAIKLNKVRKGGHPDLHTMAIKLIHDWQEGVAPPKPGK